MSNYVGSAPAPAGVVLVGDTNPVGAIAFFHAPPDASYLRLNGQIIGKTAYPDLWAYAQGFLTADQVANPGLYKSIDGSTFAVPKLDGLFIRAVGTLDANHIAAALGVKQADANLSHRHGILAYNNPGANTGQLAGGGANTGTNTTDIQLDGGPEARPVNVALVPCVKALRSLLVPGASVVGAASQTEQEAGTAADKYVAPLTQKYSPSAAKVYCVFDATGLVAQGYGVSSVTDNGTGDWSVNFTTAFTTKFSGNFKQVGAFSIGAGQTLFYMTTIHSVAPGFIRCHACYYTGSTNNCVALDASENHAIVFGDLP